MPKINSPCAGGFGTNRNWRGANVQPVSVCIIPRTPSTGAVTIRPLRRRSKWQHHEKRIPTTPPTAPDRDSPRHKQANKRPLLFPARQSPTSLDLALFPNRLSSPAAGCRKSKADRCRPVPCSRIAGALRAPPTKLFLPSSGLSRVAPTILLPQRERRRRGEHEVGKTCLLRSSKLWSRGRVLCLFPATDASDLADVACRSSGT